MSVVETTVRRATAFVAEPVVAEAPLNADGLLTVREAAVDQSLLAQSSTERTAAALALRLVQTSASQAVATRAIASLVAVERQAVIARNVQRAASASVEAMCASVRGKHARRLQGWYRYWRSLRHLRRIAGRLVRQSAVAGGFVHCRGMAPASTTALTGHRYVVCLSVAGLDAIAIHAETVRVLAALTLQVECSWQVAQAVTASALVSSAKQATARVRLQAAWRRYRRRRRRSHLRVCVVSWTTTGLSAVYTSRTATARRLAALRQRHATRVLARAWRRHRVRRIYRLECACASTLQRWLRPRLHRRRCQRRLQRFARRFVQKKIWSSATLLAGDTTTYFALWLYRGSAWVSCVLHQKRGLLELNTPTSNYLRRVQRDHDLAALDITNHLLVRETPRGVLLALPPTFNLQAQLQRSQSLSVLNQGKVKPPARSVLATAVTLSVDDTLQSLLDGRDVNERNALGETPLHLVLTPPRGFDDNDARDAMLTFLLEQAADVDARDYDGVTPLMRAAEAGDIRGITRLLDAGAAIRAVDNKGYNALHRACAKNQVATVEFLAGRPALTTASYDGMFPLHMAALLGHASVAVALQNTTSIDASLLRSCKADLNAGDARGDTPLHWTAIAGNQKLLQHLLNLGCDTSLHNTDWHTALDEATAAGQRGCAELLRRAAPSTRGPQAASTSYIRLHELMAESTDIHSMYLRYDEPFARDKDVPHDGPTDEVDVTKDVVDDAGCLAPSVSVEDELPPEAAEPRSPTLVTLPPEMHDGAAMSTNDASRDDPTSGGKATDDSEPGVSGPCEYAADEILSSTASAPDDVPTPCAMEEDALSVEISHLDPDANDVLLEQEAAEPLVMAQDNTEYDIRIEPNAAPLLEETYYEKGTTDDGASEDAIYDPACDPTSLATTNSTPYDASQYIVYDTSEYAVDSTFQDTAYDASQYAGYEASQYAGYEPSQYTGYDASQYTGYDGSQYTGYDASQYTGYDASVYDPSQYTGYDASQYAGYDYSQPTEPTVYETSQGTAYDHSQPAGYDTSTYGYYESNATDVRPTGDASTDEAGSMTQPERDDRTYEMDAVSDAYEICIGDESPETEMERDTDDDDDYGTAFPAVEDSLFDDKPHLSTAMEPDKEASPRIQ
ncbi:hypothetical protein SPRG_22066 [Saprolegnia parasitica CBS 223.65]|uniref:Uncharacterized protein n=1 Tax=Saprolegnia parasitica (strain CBS 223.65) TaxID=695850 RepID=A0A067CTD2_SAPPC|nr:hypothetical protein SPRG_22066 [Saprolegnia parasitica CBS 223.65]KDO33969.1 hypothetical protein SPRG_22066 [Saprolegnia parasitica CBS 223.65]|eukprot:XP_012195330.1 hypothetical protein SPRG_22066 [Saprolegnia parasitica CBS 223.65]